MNRYLIQQKIKTLSIVEGNSAVFGVKADELKAEMELDGFKFRQWQSNLRDGWLGEGWVAEIEVEATDGIQALNNALGQLWKIIPKVCFISQCSMDFDSQSFLILKQTDNEERKFFYRYTYAQKDSGLHFGQKEMESYKDLNSYPYPSVFRYLQESNNSSTYFPKLSLLLSALEAMSGKVEKTKEDGSIITIYNKDLMIKILGGELYNKVFGANGLRHRFYHGDFDFQLDKDYVDEIYWAIIKYFNSEYKTKLSLEVKSPQRHFYDNYYETKLWIKPVGVATEISIPFLEADYKKENSEFGNFVDINQPKDY